MVINDFSTGSRDNLTNLADNLGGLIIEDDVTHCPALGQLVADSDYVFHLAAAVSRPRRAVSNPHNRDQLKSARAILEAAAGRTPLLLPSSSEVYGKSSREGFDENDDLLIGLTLSRWSTPAQADG